MMSQGRRKQKVADQYVTFCPPPPPEQKKTFLGGLLKKKIFFHLQIKKSKMVKNVFVLYKKINLGSKGKILIKEKFQYFKKVFNGYPCKNVTKYFCTFFVSEHSFSLFSTKTILVAYWGLTAPPPFTYRSVTFMFFLRLLLEWLTHRSFCGRITK